MLSVIQRGWDGIRVCVCVETQASRKGLGGKGWLLFESIIKVRLVGDLRCTGEQFSFVFFNVTTPISLFRWEEVLPVGMENGSVLSFSI